MVRVSLLVFKGAESIGEYVFTSATRSEQQIAAELVAKLKPSLSCVVLGAFGIAARSGNLHTSNPWRAR